MIWLVNFVQVTTIRDIVPKFPPVSSQPSFFFHAWVLSGFHPRFFEPSLFFTPWSKEFICLADPGYRRGIIVYICLSSQFFFSLILGRGNFGYCYMQVVTSIVFIYFLRRGVYFTPAQEQDKHSARWKNNQFSKVVLFVAAGMSRDSQCVKSRGAAVTETRRLVSWKLLQSEYALAGQNF